MPALCRKVLCKLKPSTNVFCLSPLWDCFLGSQPLACLPSPFLILQVLALNCPYSLSSFHSPCISLSSLSMSFIPYLLEIRTGTWRFIQGWRPRTEDTWTENSKISQSTWTGLSTQTFLPVTRDTPVTVTLLLQLGLPAFMPGAPYQTHFPHRLPVNLQFNIDEHLSGTYSM